MLNQNVTDNFPTVKAPLQEWPVMPVEAYVGLSGEGRGYNRAPHRI
jgi:hypothetical protein